MLYPTNPSVENMSYADLYKSVTKGHVKATSGTIYDLVGDEYVKILSGFYMDYESIMNSRIDYVRTYQDGEAFFRTYKSEVERLLMTQLSWLRHVGIRLKKPVPRIGWIVAQRKIHEDAIYTIENLKHPVFAVFHYCLPHYPYAWAREGEREWSVDTVNLHTVSNYLGNVQRLDRVVEEIMNALHDRHEDCLVILTSDHAWRMDPDLANWEVLNDYPAEMIDEEPDSPFRHVPLIVYTGRSGDVGLVGKSINVGDLHLILSRYLAGESIMTADWPRVKNY